MPYVSSDGAEIYFESHGEGPAIVLAHGAEGNALSWFQQVPIFAKHYRTVLYEHRGFGRSTCSRKALQPSKFGADLLAVMTALKIDRASIVAQSMAGWSAMQAALAAPQRISSIVMVATSGGLAAPSGSDAPPAVDPLPLAGRLSQLALAPSFPGREPALAWLFDQVSLRNKNIELLAGRLGLLENLISPESVAGYTTPTLVIACDQDTFFPPDLLRRVAAIIPGAGYVTISRSGHAPYWETPAMFNDVILKFVREHWASM
ncbi:MAG: alpha/beta hydrolase [Alphaproteobacteria bacterium]|nr:alpha/beta hydrolase [Alphaproteobacteria bacterium]